MRCIPHCPKWKKFFHYFKLPGLIFMHVLFHNENTFSIITVRITFFQKQRPCVKTHIQWWLISCDVLWSLTTFSEIFTSVLTQDFSSEFRCASWTSLVFVSALLLICNLINFRISQWQESQRCLLTQQYERAEMQIGPALFGRVLAKVCQKRRFLSLVTQICRLNRGDVCEWSTCDFTSSYSRIPERAALFCPLLRLVSHAFWEGDSHDGVGSKRSITFAILDLF